MAWQAMLGRRLYLACGREKDGPWLEISEKKGKHAGAANPRCKRGFATEKEKEANIPPQAIKKWLLKERVDRRTSRRGEEEASSRHDENIRP